MPRKVAFSGKKKKEQLALKKHGKRVTHNPFLLNKSLRDSSDSDEEKKSGSSGPFPDVRKINFQASRAGQTNRYAFHFYQESEKLLKELKLDGHRAVDIPPKTALEIDDRYFVGYDFPKRPDWSYEMSKEKLDFNENKSFRDFMQQIEKCHYDEKKQLSYCELNLETWRQLWRVLELSDIFLVIVDIRYPTLMFPPSLYNYVRELGKDMILVLNKIDLATPETVVAWRCYFKEKYPNIHIVTFTSYPGSEPGTANKTLQRRRRFGKLRMAIHGAQRIQEKCAEIVRNAPVDLTSWREKIESELVRCSSGAEEEDDDDDAALEVEEEAMMEDDRQFDFRKLEKFKDGILTIGCLGFPNVGKSSLMNALMGRKVVSVSRTPGHTKHFQTIFLTKTVRLCDCPGLVFPSSVPRSLQVLMGSYPIAQLREPYGPLRYLAERVNLQGILNLHDPDVEKADEWSPVTICDAWATKRGFITARSARPDTYRAANNILRMALDGKIVMSLRPQGFFERLEYWKAHPDNAEILEIMNRKGVDLVCTAIAEEEEESDESSSEEVGESNEDAEEGSSRLASKNPFDLLSEEC